MKTCILLLIIGVSTFPIQICSAQTEIKTPIIKDTLYANDTKNVALFFPNPIRQGITGSENFVFTFNREKEQHLGLLQAKPGNDSNLLVISNNGSIFSYIVRYKKQLNKLNYFFALSNSIGNEKPLVSNSIKSVTAKDSIDNRTYYYQKFCSYLLNINQRIGRIKKRNEGIILSVDNIVFDKEELYYVIQIKNTSRLDYDINFLKLSVETRQKGKKKSLQRLYKNPIYTQNTPFKIAANTKIKFVYVVPKFSISNNRRVILELKEQNGERNIDLKISHKYINNPN
ncbi:conjugative transposon protein TraN [Polaribacter sp. Z014]|uniref:DUF4138 domain-containing protein n=1 Tax=Polaribacter sp. Z014 TaxID=2927126 RepID=UPI002020A14E|nr:DUF4138 domain-containing protein [Polaribacter sp. Z014]MCL7764498.1 conjugative transposon protein TraN [Polaribacter sp. Z014]